MLPPAARRLARLALLVLLVVALGACGGGDDPTIGGASGGAECGPAGERLTMSADDIKYDKECLAAPANRPFAIVFSNEENLPHDIDILAGESSNDRVFDGEIFSGEKTVTYQVPPLAPGTYTFRCDVHRAQMHGILRVR
ncbi:MAG TPA: cupredoxin domain-containing protein [Acidimicrobiales bacterium]|nr:cupredoxin domain-containing protein [Acidimicrobiales bacterium]